LDATVAYWCQLNLKNVVINRTPVGSSRVNRLLGEAPLWGLE